MASLWANIEISLQLLVEVFATVLLQHVFAMLCLLVITKNECLTSCQTFIHDTILSPFPRDNFFFRGCTFFLYPPESLSPWSVESGFVGAAGLKQKRRPACVIPRGIDRETLHYTHTRLEHLKKKCSFSNFFLEHCTLLCSVVILRRVSYRVLEVESSLQCVSAPVWPVGP